jgi:DNA-directed RNA polymerase specialized sigma24 family protein
VRPGLRRPIRKIKVTSGDPQAASNRPTHMNHPAVDAAPAPIRVQWDADRALTAMYSDHYRCLVRLAALLVHDVATAENVVQDSFAAMHTAWRRLGDGDKALAYLRHSVVNRSRSVLREPGVPSPLGNAAVVRALGSLPARQREALVLLYYGDLSEAQAASAMGVSEGAVKRHLAEAVAALAAVMEMDA